MIILRIGGESDSDLDIKTASGESFSSWRLARWLVTGQEELFIRALRESRNPDPMGCDLSVFKKMLECAAPGIKRRESDEPNDQGVQDRARRLGLILAACCSMGDDEGLAEALAFFKEEVVEHKKIREKELFEEAFIAAGSLWAGECIEMLNEASDGILAKKPKLILDMVSGGIGSLEKRNASIAMPNDFSWAEKRILALLDHLDVRSFPGGEMPRLQEFEHVAKEDGEFWKEANSGWLAKPWVGTKDAADLFYGLRDNCFAKIAEKAAEVVRPWDFKKDPVLAVEMLMQPRVCRKTIHLLLDAKIDWSAAKRAYQECATEGKNDEVKKKFSFSLRAMKNEVAPAPEAFRVMKNMNLFLLETEGQLETAFATMCAWGRVETVKNALAGGLEPRRARLWRMRRALKMAVGDDGLRGDAWLSLVMHMQEKEDREIASRQVAFATLVGSVSGRFKRFFGVKGPADTNASDASGPQKVKRI